MTSTGYLFICDSTTTSIGDSSQRIEVSNFTGTATWNLTFAATGGATSSWSDGGSNSYDFNDPGGSPNGCTDGGDTDSIAGQLSVDPSAGTSTPRAGCSNTGISLGSASAYNEGTIDSITLMSASSSAETSCSWQLTGADVDQQIPQDQTNANYTINLTLTVTAS